MSESLQGLLAFTGTGLFLLSLLEGFAIPRFKSPRIGLSAHVAGVQSGIALIAFAWLGGRLTLSEGWAAAIAHTLWISLYVTWAGLVLGAAFGTGRTLPIAGAGLRAQPWQENGALALIGSGSLGIAIGVALLLWNWSWRAL